MSSKFHKFLYALSSADKSRTPLSHTQMKEAMGMMLEGTAISEQTSAFLLLWRAAGEQLQELAGALEAMQERTRFEVLHNSLELGYALEGKTHALPMMLLSAKMLGKLPLVIHGDRAQASKLGFNAKDFYDNAKLASNIRYFDRSNFLPQLCRLTDMRRALGLRTAFNTLEKLHRVAKSDYALVGISHTPSFELYKQLYKTHYKRLLIVRGQEGSPDILQKSTVLVVENERSHSFPVDPAEFGLAPYPCDKELSLNSMLEQLKHPNKLTLGYARLNAALMLYAADKTPNIEAGFSSLKGAYDKLLKKQKG